MKPARRVTLTIVLPLLGLCAGAGAAVALGAPLAWAGALLAAALPFAGVAFQLARRSGGPAPPPVPCERLLCAIATQSRDGIVLLDPATRRMLWSNAAAERLLGGAVQVDCTALLARLLVAERACADQIAHGMPMPVREMPHTRADGAELLLELAVSRVVFEDRHVLSIALRDVSERHRLEEQMRYFAYHDVLTRLPNRMLFTDRLDQALAQAVRAGEPLAVLFVDLDDFKAVNDTLGHDAGDLLLVEVAARLKSCVRKGDTVARQGGDEFMVLLARVDAPDRAGEIAGRILDALRRPYLLHGRQMLVSASIGVAVYPADGADTATLMRSADLAMYAAKQAGRNAWQLHDEGMSARVGNVLELKTDLLRALERGEFLLHYQPQVDGSDDRLVAFEALIRWRSPQRGLVPPLQFIPVAEETGLIVPIGEWVLREVCRQIRAWDDAGLPPVRVAVNVSARQFVQSDLVERVRTIVTAAEVDPRRIEIEVTESIAMKNAEHAAAALEALKALGFEVALDDFGTGHSSLAYLRQFPFDRLKMDRGFLRDATASESDRAIIEAIVVLAHSLGLEVVAEGVETQEHIELLRAFGCDLLQGYGIARPMDVDAATGLLGASAARVAA